MERPNIFRYSKSSTLNIAMIGWALDFIQYGGELENLGKDIIKGLSNGAIDKVEKIKVINMYKNIELVIEVNDDYVITVEDITFAKNQYNLLKKHREIILNDSKYTEMKKIFAYLHIGNKIKCSRQLDENCRRISRQDVLNIMRPYKKLGNEIIEDYLSYIERIEKYTYKYTTEEDLTKWHRLTWEGYFNKIKIDLDKCDLNWEYLSNASGEQLSFWWNKLNKRYVGQNDLKVDYSVYIQLEANLPSEYNYEYNNNEHYILFKVEVDENRYKSEVRNYVWDKLELLKKSYEEQGLVIEKTSHAIGTYMTIGRISNIKTRTQLNKYIKISEDIINDLDRIL